MKEIQWFPGHMAKTKRMISENISNVDIVLELLDARIPHSSKNPDLLSMVGGKPVLTLLNKTSLADPAATKAWVAHYRKNGGMALPIDCTTGDGIKQLVPAVRSLLSEKLQKYEDKGMSGRALRAMVVGIPNVGKSSLINRLSGSARAKVEDRPGVTKDKQWIRTPYSLDLLDTPGVLWPKFDDRLIGENLAVTGAVRDGVLDIEEIAAVLAGRLYENSRALLTARYKLKEEDCRALAEASESEESFRRELLSAIGKKRGFLISGGEIDMEHASVMLLDEFRGGKIGRISLEAPREG